MASSNKVRLEFTVEMDTEKGVVTYVDTTVNNGEKVVNIDKKRVTVSQASEIIRNTMMEHKRNRYSRY